MKKFLIVLFFWIPAFAGMTIPLQAQEYYSSDTLIKPRTTAVNVWDTLSLSKTSLKVMGLNITVLSGNGIFSFSQGTATARDTVLSYDSLIAGNQYMYSNIISQKAFVKGAGAGVTYKMSIYYGSGSGIFITPLNPNSITGTIPVVNSSNWSKAEYGNRDTTNATADTLSRQIDLVDTSKTLADKFTQWWQCWFTSDDTIQISSSASFPANDITIILPGETWTSQPNNVTYRTNYYWKILGTGTAYVRKKVWGI